MNICDYYAYRTVVRHLVDAAAEVTGYTAAEITSPCREQQLCRIRHAVMLIARRKGASLKQIAHGLKRVDHTTVLNGLRRGSLLLDDPEFAGLVQTITIVSGIDEPRLAVAA